MPTETAIFYSFCIGPTSIPIWHRHDTDQATRRKQPGGDLARAFARSLQSYHNLYEVTRLPRPHYGFVETSTRSRGFRDLTMALWRPPRGHKATVTSRGGIHFFFIFRVYFFILSF